MSTKSNHFEKQCEIVRRLPDGQHFQMEKNGSVKMQASGDAVKRVRECFPGAIWEKEKCDDLSWWEYRTEWDGVPLRIYADYVGPAACHKITEEYETIEKVPVAFEERIITKTRTRWVCPGDEDNSHD